MSLIASMNVGHPETDDQFLSTAIGVVIEYSVTNNTDAPIRVATGVASDQFSGAAGRPRGPEGVWVTATDSGVVQFSKQVFDVDPDVLLEAPYSAPAEQVEPGDSMEGRGFTPLPLRRVAPDPGGHIIVPGPLDLPDEPTAWQFCLNVGPGVDDPMYLSLDNHGQRVLICTDPQPFPDEARDATP